MECVPNFSEGADQDALDAIGSALAGQEGTWVLDRTADIDHGRSVFTLAGASSAVAGAMVAAAGAAIERIDMRMHVGTHPCVGSVDVIPFIPLAGMTMDQCVASARELGATIAERYSLPVYLYARAATRPMGRSLADIRRSGFGGLAGRMAEEDGQPDFGPRTPHPTAGAVAVGARPFLIAYNIQLATTDIAVARRMATAIRERDGGLAAVQALGIDLALQGCTQLSMNLLDHARTPIWRVWETAEELAGREGVSVLDSELVGLAPQQALTDVADHIGIGSSVPIEQRITEAAAWLRIRDFTPMMALELRLDRIRAGG